MALSDFTNPKKPWRIQQVTPPSHCHIGETITFTLTLTCSAGHSIAGGTYDPETDTITFPNVCVLTRKEVGEDTEITCTFAQDPPVTGSWTADDSGNDLPEG